MIERQDCLYIVFFYSCIYYCIVFLLTIWLIKISIITKVFKIVLHENWIVEKCNETLELKRVSDFLLSLPRSRLLNLIWDLMPWGCKFWPSPHLTHHWPLTIPGGLVWRWPWPPYYNACNLDLLVYLYLCISICVFVFSRLIHNGASRFLEGGFGGDRPNISRAECNFGLPGNQGWVLGTLSLDWYLVLWYLNLI